jgi:hypothetical protein
MLPRHRRTDSRPLTQVLHYPLSTAQTMNYYGLPVLISASTGSRLHTSTCTRCVGWMSRIVTPLQPLSDCCQGVAFLGVRPQI